MRFRLLRVISVVFAMLMSGCGATLSSAQPSKLPKAYMVSYLKTGTLLSQVMARHYVGIELPVGPPIYSSVIHKMHMEAIIRSGPFVYDVGTLEGEPVVINVPPLDGITIRSLATERMETIFHIGTFIYEGTSGSHLRPLSFGDVVIAARIVDFGNFITSRTGAMIPGEFHNTEPGIGAGKFLYLYSNPTLVNMVAQVAIPHSLGKTPARVLDEHSSRYPWVMKFGTQGSSEMWLKDPALIAASDKVFHEVDESGDYPSALASVTNHVPFIEWNTISDNALKVPTQFNAFFHEDSLFAQRRSNTILFKLLHLMAQRHMISPPPSNPTTDPYAPGTFQHALTPPSYVEHP
ncbi:hypothetical protein [Sulfobacillus thermosulfidooxidans]|uniref:hypothetical protein n=1 Tax=Sulfobacillus thermosulfidooxidans TaxID=28034 RepID=UPI0006B5AEA5|nr:hypothetical protein [Sulfobacillus thermosulfidooxidans]